MSFDPNKYLEQKGELPETDVSGEFSPDKYLEKKGVATGTEDSDSGPKAGPLPTVTANLAQGLSMGLSDEFAGGVEALGDAAGIEGLGGDITEIGMKDEGPGLSMQRLIDAYRRGRDTERGVLEKTQKDNPKLAMGSDLVGGVLAPIPGAGIIKGGKAAATGVKALAKQGGKEVVEQGAKKALMSGAKTGAIAGGIEGIGRTDSEDPMDWLTNAAGGAGLGYAGGKVIDKIGARNSKKALEELVETGDKEINKTALNALGATKADFAKELGTKTSTRATADTAKGTGSTVLEEGVIKARQTADQLKQDLVNKLDEVYNDRMLPTLQRLDDASVDLPTERIQEPLQNFNNNLRNTMENLVGGSNYAEEASGKIYNNMIGTAEKVHNDVLSALKSPNKFAELNKIKKKLQNEVNWENQDVSTYNNFLMGTQADISKLMNDLSGKVSPELGQQMVKNNKTYGNLLRANEIAGRGMVASQQANNKIGLGEYVAAGVISGVTDNKLLGPATIAGKRLAEKYAGKDLSKLMSTTSALRQQKNLQRAKKVLSELPDSPFKMAMQGQANTIAKSITNSAAAMLDDKDSTEPYKRDRDAADFVRKASPEEIMRHAELIRQKHGNDGARLADTLQKISEKSPTGRNALIFSLLQNKDNRRMLGLMDDTK